MFNEKSLFQVKIDDLSLINKQKANNDSINQCLDINNNDNINKAQPLIQASKECSIDFCVQTIKNEAISLLEEKS